MIMRRMKMYPVILLMLFIVPAMTAHAADHGMSHGQPCANPPTWIGQHASYIYPHVDASLRPAMVTNVTPNSCRAEHTGSLAMYVVRAWQHMGGMCVCHWTRILAMAEPVTSYTPSIGKLHEQH